MPACKYEYQDMYAYNALYPQNYITPTNSWTSALEIEESPRLYCCLCEGLDLERGRDSPGLSVAESSQSMTITDAMPQVDHFYVQEGDLETVSQNTGQEFFKNN